MKQRKFSLVILAGSAGALENIEIILSAMPERFTVPVLVVVHRMRNIQSGLADIFRRKRTVIPVQEITDKEEIRPGTIYIAPANYHVLIEDDRTFALDYSELVNYSRPSIDVTFDSASQVLGPGLVTVLLSGANEDGTAGTFSAKARGALTIVQDPADAEFKTMPASALKVTTPDHLLPSRGIATLIADIVK
jgi:two-component system, chemotaxis family, protein-glutamate methylesterase/glutaminase